jgi:hypothetical protein
MVVDNFDIPNITVKPNKTDAPLLINPNTMLLQLEIAHYDMKRP